MGRSPPHPGFEREGSFVLMVKKILDHFEECIGSIILLVMATITFANVITRYFVYRAISFTEEITINFFVWIVLLGISIAYRQGSNLSMTFFYDLMPLRWKKFSFYLSTILSSVFFALLAYLGYIEVMDELALDVTTESLGISVVWYTIALPVFSVLIIIRILQGAAATLRKNEF